MSLLSSLLKGVGKVASIASPFLGKFGPLAGIAGGLLAGGDDSKKASAYEGQIGQIGGQQAKLAGYANPLIQALLRNSGYDPTTGSYDPSFNPNAASADTLFNPDSLNGMIVAGQEAGAPAYDSAVNSIRSDFLRRGFGGGSNTGFNSAVAGVRTDQARDNAAARRGLLYNLAGQKRAYLMSGQDYGRNNLNNALQLSANSAQGALGTFGGLQGLYANRADQANQGVQQAIGQGAQSGIFNPIVDNVGSWLKGRFGLGNRTQRSGVGTPPINGSGGGYTPRRTTGGAAGSVGWGLG